MVLSEFLDEWNNAQECVLVHTSGSTGKPKPMMVEKKRMLASARITCDFLGLKEGDSALLCMPLDYIAGKMVVVRSIERHLKLIDVKPSGHPLRDIDVIPTFAAMVPMQVFNSMQDANELQILKAIKHLIIGGGAIDADMARELRSFPNSVWSTYGMTETLSHIALRRLSGNEADDYYTPFDSVNISIADDGCLVIDAPEVCAHVLKTNDIVELHDDGRRFRIIGRKDNVIDSGGIKLHIEDIEAKLKPHMPCPFIITKKPDSKFGEIVVMLVCSDDITSIRDICSKQLTLYECPKGIYTVSEIPTTGTGKPSRVEAERIALTL